MKRNSKGQFLPNTHWREPQLFRDKEWLTTEYVTNQRSTGDIARQFNVTDGAILFWLRKHDIKRRTVSEAREIKYWGSSGEDNPMWGKAGDKNPNWKGGISAERQLFYESQEWKNAVREIWKRDDASCQECGISNEECNQTLHIHHINSFQHKDMRCELSNLVLLCKKCHSYVHSNKNIYGDRKWLSVEKTVKTC